ncbi:polysaccharide deacetylase family protein [Candidatus Woesearchaeota archaeon]|nr:polysaccharide deacetylase family protein [Candidatus Woesearchaeota archaeon]
MITINSLKIGIYNFSDTVIGRNILRLLSKFAKARNLRKSKPGKRKKFLIVITIDTESGYTAKNSKRMWQKQQRDAYIGYYKGIENWRNLLNHYNAKATFFLSTNCFSAKGQQLTKILTQLRHLIKEKHEIGLHIHPDSDLALQKELNEKFQYTSSRFYDYIKISQFVKAGKQLIRKNTGIIPASFRWGNWALDTAAVKALQSNGFKVDSSATPGIKGHLNDGMHYDWSKAKEHYPWRLSLSDYQNTLHKNSKVLEMPIATFNLLGMTLRADPVYPELLKAAFDYYYRNADRSKKPFAFVVISHSIEGTHIDGSPTRVIKDMEEFLSYASKFVDVGFVTINEAYKRIK